MYIADLTQEWDILKFSKFLISVDYVTKYINYIPIPTSYINIKVIKFKLQQKIAIILFENEHVVTYTLKTL